MEHYPEPPTIPLILPAPDVPGDADDRVRVSRGWYASLAVDGPAWERRRRASLARCAAVLAMTSAQCLSHESAALVHGLWMRAQEPDVSVIVRSNPPRTTMPLPPVPGGRSGVSLRRRRVWVTAEDVVTVSGLRVTSLRRTALDCAFDLPAREAVCVVDSALRALCRPSRTGRRDSERRLSRELDRLRRAIGAQGPRRGRRRALAVVAIASGWAESPGESVLRWFVRAIGLPEPGLQYGIEVPRTGQRFFPDLMWPSLRIYLEFDGDLKYQAPADLLREKRRRDELARLGWRCVHVTWRDLNDLERLRGTIVALFPDDVVRALVPVRDLWC